MANRSGFRRALASLMAASMTALGAISVLAPQPAAAESTPTGVSYHRITFPVEGPVRYTDDFGDCRSGCSRNHMGNDLMGTKLQREVAASDGTIAWVHGTNRGTAGNMLQLTGKDGWVYWYIHINNDTPGTDDGKNPARWRLAPGIREGSSVKAGQHIAYMGDSGNAEGTQPHLHFEIHTPNGVAINPYTSLRLAQGLPGDGLCRAPSNPAAHPALAGGAGYWTLGQHGGVLGFGSARTYRRNAIAKAAVPATPPAKAVSIAATATGKGYWVTHSNGAIQSFGDARIYGSPVTTRLKQPIVGMTVTPTGNGYWLFARDGGVFEYGDAKLFGSTAGKTLNAPIIAMAGTTTGRGYWLLASDGGVFTFGDAKFYGSTGAMKLNQPIVGMGAAAGGRGYWLLARDGGMFTFGPAKFHGSLPGLGWCPGAGVAVAFTGTRTGLGYWVVLADGRVLAFGDAQHFGDAPAKVQPVAFAAAPPPPIEPA